jgi:predicted HTH domain antitoxin
LVERAKTEAALALYRKGSISSGLAAKWINLPRVQFISLSARAGIEMLEDSQDDFDRERSLLSATRSAPNAA